MRPVHFVLVLLVASFVARGWMVSRVKAPWCDEGWFAAAAHNIAFAGHSGLPVEPTGFFLDQKLTGIQQHTFLVPPLHLWLLAGWYRVVGFGLDQTRMYGVLWGAAGLVVMFGLFQAIWRRPWLSLLAAAVCALDFVWLWASADGRMDVAVMVLSLAGWWAWFYWRGNERGLVVAHACFALACLAHLNAVISLAALWLMILWRGRRGLSVRAIAWAAVPFALAGVAWILYVDGHWDEFRTQFVANARGHSALGRVAASWQPWIEVLDELITRYFAAFGLKPFWLHATPPLYPLVVLIPFGAAFTVLFQGRPWRGRGGGLLLMAFAQIGVYALFVRFKAHNYLAYLMPLWSMLLALFLWRWWHRAGARRFVAVMVASVWVAMQLFTFTWKLRQPDRAEFEELAQYLRRTPFPADAYLSGPTLLVFGVGYGRWVEDNRIGLRSGRRPDVVVLDSYAREFETVLVAGEPDVWLAYLKSFREEYRPLRRVGPYEVWVRRAPEIQASTGIQISKPPSPVRASNAAP